MTGQHLTNYLDVVRIVNRLQAPSIRSYGFLSNTSKRFFFTKHSYQLWDTPNFMFCGYLGCFLRVRVD
jgi:hypothetical protein